MRPCRAYMDGRRAGPADGTVSDLEIAAHLASRPGTDAGAGSAGRDTEWTWSGRDDGDGRAGQHQAQLTEADADVRPISQVLRTLGEQAEGETLTIGDIVEALGDRAMAILLILFCLPNCVPVPPGVGLVFGFPMLLVALQMVVGRHKPWLPAAVLVGG